MSMFLYFPILKYQVLLICTRVRTHSVHLTHRSCTTHLTIRPKPWRSKDFRQSFLLLGCNDLFSDVLGYMGSWKPLMSSTIEGFIHLTRSRLFNIVLLLGIMAKIIQHLRCSTYCCHLSLFFLIERKVTSCSKTAKLIIQKLMRMNQLQPILGKAKNVDTNPWVLTDFLQNQQKVLLASTISFLPHK